MTNLLLDLKIVYIQLLISFQLKILRYKYQNSYKHYKIKYFQVLGIYHIQIIVLNFLKNFNFDVIALINYLVFVNSLDKSYEI